MLVVLLAGILYASKDTQPLRSQLFPGQAPHGNPWHNDANPYDVNLDASVTAADVTHVRRALPAWRGISSSPALPRVLAPILVGQFYDQFLKVDVSGDWFFTLDDLAMFYGYPTGRPPSRRPSLWQNPFNRFDVNGDGVVTLTDVSALRRAIPAWRVLPPAGVIDGGVYNTDGQAFFNQYGFVDVSGDYWDVNVDAGELEVRDVDLKELYSHLTGGSRRSVSLWQNPVNRYDINGDGSVTLADVTKVRTALPAWQQLSGAAKANGGVTDPASTAFFWAYGYVDVDGDQDINANDLVDLHRHLAPSSTSLWQNPVNGQDVNGDGSVTSADADKVRNAINNWQQLPASAKANGGVNDPAGRTFFDRYGYVDVNGDGDVTRADEQGISIIAPWRSEAPAPQTRPRSSTPKRPAYYCNFFCARGYLPANACGGC